MKSLTIFTPTFNRASLLPRLYDSLKAQTNQDFVWMIINDGSSDNTDEVVQSFLEENVLEIQYIKQKNQECMARTIQRIKIAKQNSTLVLMMMIWPENAVELILEKWNSLGENQQKYSGIVALDAYFDGKLIGSQFTTESTTLERFLS
jgi:glycosyltransferase involved in cell wall biosynthesis